jgi:uncharacterized membrane protein (UPF0127 family)
MNPMRKQEIEIGGQKFEVDLADRVIDHFIGMRGCKQGKMLFDFGKSRNYRIDMFLVQTELYLYFIDSEKKVIEKKKALPWTWDPRTWRFYRSKQEYRYLLESSTDLDLEKGEKVEFQL